jgi:hypothetical protein
MIPTTAIEEKDADGSFCEKELAMSQKYRSIADLYTLSLADLAAWPAPAPRANALPTMADLLYGPSALRPRGALGALSQFFPDPKRLNKSRHDAMLDRLLVARRRLLMSDLRADLPNWPNKPEKIVWKRTGDGHVPDLTSRYLNGQLLIEEVETIDTIGIDHTRQQCLLFSTFASEHGALFNLVVPFGDEWRARSQLNAWGIFAGVVSI